MFPATRNPDGSVRLQVTSATSTLVRHYIVNAYPPAVGEPSWTWADPDPTLVRTTDAIHELTDSPLVDVALGVVAGRPVGMTSSSTMDNPFATESESDMSVEDQVDIETDRLATQTGTMTAIETAYATAYRECGRISLPSWEWTDETKSRWAPVNFSSILSKFYTEFEWNTSKRTSLGVAMTGAGRNYQAGLSALNQQDTEAGISRVKGFEQKDQIHNWKLPFQWRKQREWCFNDGYSFYTGRTRWVPYRQVTGLVIPSDATRFSCNPANRSLRLEGNLWVTRSTTSQWNGWFQIGTVELSSAQSRTTGIKLTYKLQPGKNHGYLCGRDDDPIYASFSQEVPDP